MSADHHPFAGAEAWLREHRPTLIEKLEEAMSHLQDLIDNGKKLAAERAALITDRDAQKARADAAESHASDLQAQLDANDKLASDANDDIVAEIAKEAGVATDGSAPAASTIAAPQPDPSAPAVITTVGTATVTVDPAAGATTHVDATGTTTTVPHDGSDPTAETSGGVAVTPDPAAVAAATNAAAQAGVTVTPAAPAAA